MSEQICLELKFWICSFQNIRNSLPEMSSRKGTLKTKILPNSLKNIRDTVFKLTKFKAKDQQAGRRYFSK